ncbi:hypothetical protein VTO73DRAFT_9123 [Trametes versicolor]
MDVLALLSTSPFFARVVLNSLRPSAIDSGGAVGSGLTMTWDDTNVSGCAREGRLVGSSLLTIPVFLEPHTRPVNRLSAVLWSSLPCSAPQHRFPSPKMLRSRCGHLGTPKGAVSLPTVHWSQLLPINGGLIEGNYTLLASTCVFYYDYLLTFPTEVRVFWRRQWNLATIYYFLIRYGFLVNITLVAISSIRFTPNSGPMLSAPSCGAFLYVAVALGLLNYAVVSAFVATRMYALWNCNVRVAICLFILGLINPNAMTPTLIYQMRIVMSPWPVWGCESYIQDYDDDFIEFAYALSPISTVHVFLLTLLSSRTQTLPIIVSSIGIAYELLCLLLTAHKTWSFYLSRRRSGSPTTLASLLLRDGSLYFVVMAALSLVNIVAAVIPGTPANVQVNAVFGRALTPILTARFIAHLQEVDRGDRHDTTLLEPDAVLDAPSHRRRSPMPFWAITREDNVVLVQSEAEKLTRPAHLPASFVFVCLFGIGQLPPNPNRDDNAACAASKSFVPLDVLASSFSLVDRFSFFSFRSFCGVAAGGSGDFARPTPYCDDRRPNAAEKSLGGDDGFLSGVDEDALDVVVTETREGEARLDPDDELLDIVGACRVGDVCS